jgi:hypothetical protein
MEMKKMKKLYCARQRNERTAKGPFAVHNVTTHGKGSFAVRCARTQGKERMHGKAGHLCRASFLCRGLVSLVAVRWYFAVRFVRSLPCVLRCRAFVFDFAVRSFFAMRLRLTTRQSYLCRACTA